MAFLPHIQLSKILHASPPYTFLWAFLVYLQLTTDNCQLSAGAAC
jgi:hypothetical protein